MKLNDVCLFVSNLFVIYHSKYITISHRTVEFLMRPV